MTGEICLEWIKHFDKHTAPTAHNATRLLLVDGHISHYTLELLEYARKHNIIILCYPSHSTHVFQGLDVACFGRLKELYSKYAAEHEDNTGQKISKDIFLTPFSRAYIETFTPATIASAFLSTGVHPFNRDILTISNMATSLPTSVQSNLPFHLPAAVANAAELWEEGSTGGTDVEGLDGDEEMLGEIGADRDEDTSEGPDVGVECASENGWSIDVDMDRAMAGSTTRGEGVSPLTPGEPSYRSSLHTALASIAAEFLIGDSPISSQHHLNPLPFHHLPPPPIPTQHLEEPRSELEIQLSLQLETFRRREEELVAAYRGAQAQLVLADRHCTLLQGQLNAKEMSAAARREGKGKGRLMGDGLPRVLTQGAIYEQCAENRRIEEAEQEAKRLRDIRNAEAKRVREEWNEQEQARKSADKAAYTTWKEGPLAEWEAENAARKAEGRRPRWTKPKPPKRSKPIPKPCAEVVEEPGVAGNEGLAEGEGEGEDDDDDVGENDGGESE